MKNIILMTILVLGSLAKADIVEVNENTKTVYMTLNPEMKIEIQDIGNGAYLYLSLNYNDEKSLRQIENVKSRYSDFEVKIIKARPNGKLSLQISDFYKKDLDVREQMNGIYLNLADRITPQDLAKIKNLGTKLSFAVSVSVPARIEYQSIQVVEEYRLKGSFCDSLKVSSVKDLILGFGAVQRPAGIRYTETFNNLKLNTLEKCFNIREERIGNFQDLMKLSVNTNSPDSDIVGRHSQKQDLKKEIIVTPEVVVAW